ncbi:MAG: hypothetical protein FWG30_07810 [Eubacteriaceae bacterium]|nr:hypothetical protein [Eubacteriaceae bacterium]
MPDKKKNSDSTKKSNKLAYMPDTGYQPLIGVQKEAEEKAGIDPRSLEFDITKKRSKKSKN